MKVSISILFISLFSLLSFAKENNEIFGYKLSDFGDFENTWKLVTVRYRKDTEELRFTYANDTAWKSLQKSQLVYPNQSIFAKVSHILGEDTSFRSSVEPKALRRVQFMVKDSTKFSETEGWGYLLFKPSGELFPEANSKSAVACAACHSLVANRGYVFSQIMPSLHLKSHSQSVKSEASHKVGQSNLQIHTVNVKTLSKSLREYIPQRFEQFREIRGDITQFVFAGTLDEIKPTLIFESVKHNIPAVLSYKHGQMFSIVYPDENKNICKKTNEVNVIIITKRDSSQKAAKLNYCYERLK